MNLYCLINYGLMVCMTIAFITTGSLLIFCPESMLNTTELATHHCHYQHQLMMSISVVYLITAIVMLYLIFTIDRVRIFGVSIVAFVALPLAIWYVFYLVHNKCSNSIDENVSFGFMLAGISCAFPVIAACIALIYTFIIKIIDIYCPRRYGCRCKKSTNLTEELIIGDLEP